LQKDAEAKVALEQKSDFWVEGERSEKSDFCFAYFADLDPIMKS
jgi:hypothetical protein